MIWGKTFRFNWNCCNCLTILITPPCNRPSGIHIFAEFWEKTSPSWLSLGNSLGSVADPDIQIRRGWEGEGGGGGCGHPDPELRGMPSLQRIFSPLQASVWSKYKGGGASPISATEVVWGGIPYIFAGMKPWKSFTYCSNDKNYKIYTFYSTKSITVHFLFVLVLNKYE